MNLLFDNCFCNRNIFILKFLLHSSLIISKLTVFLLICSTSGIDTQRWSIIVIVACLFRHVADFFCCLLFIFFFWHTDLVGYFFIVFIDRTTIIFLTFIVSCHSRLLFIDSIFFSVIKSSI